MRSLVKALATGTIALAFSGPALAEPITVRFTAYPAMGDPVNTGPSTGFFVFDSRLIPKGGGKVQDSTFGLGATSVVFTWGNTHYGTGNADLGELEFNRSGQLVAWVLGGTYSPFTGIGGIYALLPNPAGDDFFASTFAGIGGGSSIAYTVAGRDGLLTGRLVSDSIAVPTPEPSSLLLLAAGAAGAARMIRRRLA